MYMRSGPANCIVIRDATKFVKICNLQLQLILNTIYHIQLSYSTTCNRQFKKAVKFLINLHLIDLLNTTYKSLK